MMMATILIANVFMFAFMISTAPWLARLASVPKGILLPTIVTFCVVGSFALANRMFDVWVMLVFGVIGFGMERAGYPLGPFVIGFVLAPLGEAKLRSGLMMTAGDISPVITRPLSLLFIVVAVVLLIWPLISQLRTKKQEST